MPEQRKRDLQVLITGGAGFIGRHLTSRLIQEGYGVAVLDDGSSGRLDQVPQQAFVEPVEISRLTVNDWQAIVAGVDLVFHLAARKYRSPGVRPETLLDTNVRATEALIRASSLEGVDRLVFTSSLYVYGSSNHGRMRETDFVAPTTLYGLSKVFGEELLRLAQAQNGLEWNCARLFFTYGPGQYAQGGYKSVVVRNFERIRAGLKPIVNGSGQQILDYTFVEDMAEALLALAFSTHHGHTVNVASGRGISINDLTARMLAVAESSLGPTYQAPDATDGSLRVGDPSAIEEIFGWKARTDLDFGLRKTWESMTGSQVEH